MVVLAEIWIRGDTNIGQYDGPITLADDIARKHAMMDKSSRVQVLQSQQELKRPACNIL
jgi:hypothetical protein